jgi:pSer/pThr/pTyr-binding forkhead associated (FHA) protein
VPDPSISRSHCSLVFNGSHWVVADLASSNGTFLNGQKVEQPTIAMPGDRLGVARVEFRLEYAAAAMVTFGSEDGMTGSLTPDLTLGL